MASIFLAASSLLSAEPLRLTSAESTYYSGTEDDFGRVIDGVEYGPQGWSVEGRTSDSQSLIVACARPVEAPELDISLFFLAGKPFNPLAEFTLSFTTDQKPSLQGKWLPLEILRFNSQATTLQRVGSTRLRSSPIPYNVNGGVPDEIYRLTAILPGGRATGFRLDAHAVPVSGDGKITGLSWQHPFDFTLTEFRVAVHARETTNIALYRPVRASHPLYVNPDRTHMRPEALTDGLPATIAHPDRMPPANGFFFEIDLGQVMALDHIGLRTRGDEKFERFTRVELSLYDAAPDGGAAPAWQGMARSDGSHPPPGAVEILRHGDGKGTFHGRFLRISSDNPREYSPQLAEVEVYPTRTPELIAARADGNPIPVAGGLNIPPGVKRLSLELRIPQIGMPAGDAIRWRMPGEVDEWQTSRLMTIDMASPLPGHRMLEVQALHSDNHWDASIGQFPIFSRQHVWENRGLQGLSVALAMVAALMISRKLGQRRTARQLAEANTRVALAEERSRIARDLHDDLGANLAEIAMISELARESLPGGHPARGPLDKIFDRAESNARRLGEIVWAVNPANDTLEHFTKYLCKFTQDYLAAAGVRCRFQLPEIMPQGSFSAAQRYHLLLAAKEAIHNAVRHGAPHTVILKLSAEAGQFAAEICDDGSGCDAGAAIVSPRGCSNMRLRMESTGGSFHITSTPGQGTTVTLTTPFSP